MALSQFSSLEERWASAGGAGLKTAWEVEVMVVVLEGSREVYQAQFPDEISVCVRQSGVGLVSIS